MKKRLLTFLLSAAVALSSVGGALAVTQSDIDSLQAQKDALSESMESAQAEIERLQAEEASVLEQKAALDQQNELLRQDIELVNEQISIYDSLVEAKAEELAEAEAEATLQAERFRTRMRAMEESGSILSYLSILFQAENLSDFLARLETVSDVLTYDKETEEAYIAAQTAVETVKAEYEDLLAQQEAAKAELLAKQEQLEADLEAAYTLIASLESDIDAYTAAYEENEAAEAALQEEIDTLVAQLWQQQLEEQQQQQQDDAANGGDSSNGSTGNSGNSGNSGGGSVSAGTFIWPLPSSSTVTSAFGYRIHPIFGTEKYHSGIDISAYTGASVLAAASGTVITATYSDSYGYYVLISHGSTSTLYAHMSSLNVSAGQTVSQGDTIGYAGSTGWSTGPHLHFEVYVGGGRVDPLQYFSGYVAAY